MSDVSLLPALAINDISLNLKGRLILEKINLSLNEGDFIGLIGPNGAGKTVLLKVILGLINPDCGEVRIFGLLPKEARGLASYVPQFASFNFDFPMRVFDAVLMGRLSMRSPFARPNSDDRDVVAYWLEKLSLSDYAQRQISQLSGGEMQRVLFARALACEPKLILLDEPTASLDSRIGRSVYEILDDLSSKITIILVSHDLGVISAHVKTIACLNRRLHYHALKEISPDVLSTVYGCPIELIAHGHAHRVYPIHEEE